MAVLDAPRLSGRFSPAEWAEAGRWLSGQLGGRGQDNGEAVP